MAFVLVNWPVIASLFLSLRTEHAARLRVRFSVAVEASQANSPLASHMPKLGVLVRSVLTIYTTRMDSLTQFLSRSLISTLETKAPESIQVYGIPKLNGAQPIHDGTEPWPPEAGRGNGTG